MELQITKLREILLLLLFYCIIYLFTLPVARGLIVANTPGQR